MNTSQQKSFLMAAECLNFTQAAEKLYISQPVLSRNIAALEEEFGMLLFVRSNNTLQLTPAGEVMYQWMKEHQQSLNDALARAREASGAPSGTLRIGFVSSEQPPRRDAQAILLFQQKYPDIEISISRKPAQEIANHLLDQSLDIAAMLDTEITRDTRFSYYESGLCRSVVAVSRTHPLADFDPISLRAFANELFISVSPKYSPLMSNKIKQVCGIVGFVPRIREVSGTDEQLAVVEAQQGVALVADNHISNHNPLVRQLQLKEGLSIPFVCVWNKKNTNSSIEKYLEILKTVE